MKLLIVESPTKAKTISKFLPRTYKVLSSFGHVRDLPKSKLGIDVEHNFEPHYIVSTTKKKTVTELKKAAKGADEIYFATDHDREGEAISWHLANILNVPASEVKRITFHEITKHAIEEALKHPTSLNLDLVDAQQARRVLDRLVGYGLSPLLWSKVARGLSAGRVQSVALRLIVDREREIKAFVPQEYWSLDGVLLADGTSIPCALTALDGKKLEKFTLNNEGDAKKIEHRLHGTSGTIASITKKRTSRRPASPFITSTIQQEANHKLGYSAKLTMMLAQQLYEGIDIGSEHVGLITYMRTDSVSLSAEFCSAVREYVTKEFGKEYLPESTRAFKSSTKNAQEAHEAIRPTDVLRTPASLEKYLSPQQYKLYDIIWRRAVASQMESAKLDNTGIDVTIEAGGHSHTLHSTGSTIVFPGFLVLYKEQQKETLLPELTEGEKVALTEIAANQHFTEPPPRFNDATLVKTLEEFGVGRPSTYAATIATLEEREYVNRDQKRFIPTDIGTIVIDLLVEHFPNIVDTAFTANVEEEFDEISRGEKKWQSVIEKFYGPFSKLLEEKKQEIKKDDIMHEQTDLICPLCQKPVIIRRGRFGRFYACSGYPECKYTAKTPEEQAKHEAAKTGVMCPQCSSEIVARRSKRGRVFFGCSGYPKCTFALWKKPTGEKCPTCTALLVEQKKDLIACSNTECGYTKERTSDEE